ncbi:GntR family transcriptional regulator [Microbacterium sp. 4R-513]|uniref:GntR family transcriptional regulator n=1 Tax=Microbacterium sp. 4R-513 TaxID=2567934 RepID=UPI0013E1E862|nr:GntR family transcriptional regulator [Microbacterium sp. 4R-513]QIG40965.1 GntR family transcriptional regulator [Microbacterium sp. 4R-513]
MNPDHGTDAAAAVAAVDAGEPPVGPTSRSATETAASKVDATRARLRDEVIARLSPHDPLPPERELVHRFGVSRATIRQALARLADHGWVYRVQGSGTFVADKDLVTKSPYLTSFSEDISERGMVPGSRVLRLEHGRADERIARELLISVGARAVHIERLRTADGGPLCIESLWLPEWLTGEDLGPELLGSLYSYFEHAGASPARAHQTIRAVTLDAAQAELLETEVGAAALMVTRIVFDAHGRRIEASTGVYRGDRYDFQINVKRRA